MIGENANDIEREREPSRRISLSSLSYYSTTLSESKIKVSANKHRRIHENATEEE